MILFHFPSFVLIIFLACAFDRLLGETPRFHPLVGFGKLASHIENRFNKQNPTLNNKHVQITGFLCWSLLVITPTFLVVTSLSAVGALISLCIGTFILYIGIGARSLQEHATLVHADLASNNLNSARLHVSWLVSRDTSQLNEESISAACIESVLENGSDAIFAPIFWFCLLGPAGVVVYRLSNTLDAMWGYRSERFLHFGKAAARIDDVLNFIPARVTALTYALIGNTRCALSCWRTQAPKWDSPNAGPVMAAGAGALELQLGGIATYQNTIENRPTLGAGAKPRAYDISRAQRLVNHSLWLILALLAFSGFINCFF